MSNSETNGGSMPEGSAQTIFTREAVWKMVEKEFDIVEGNFPVASSASTTEFVENIIHTKSVELLAEKRGKFRALIDSQCPELIQAPHDLDALASALRTMEESPTRSDVLISQSLQMVITRIRKLLSGEVDEASVVRLAMPEAMELPSVTLPKTMLMRMWSDIATLFKTSEGYKKAKAMERYALNCWKNYPTN
jgi:hypothetical protein